MFLNVKELDILEEFALDYNRRVYGRGIAKRLKMNQKTVSNILVKFEKQDILKFSQEGRNKYYFLNRLNSDIKDIIKLVEIHRKIRFLNKNRKMKDLFKKLENKTKGILVVFGSYANFTRTEKSDLDMFIIGKITDIFDLEELYNLKINIVKSSKFKFSKDEHIIKEVMKNHVILKGIEEFIDLIW